MINYIYNKLVLNCSIKETIKILVDYLFKYRKRHYLSLLKKGFSEHTKTHVSTEIIARITESYQKAKIAQRDAPLEYQVGKQWQRELDNKAGIFINALKGWRLKELAGLFDNIQRKEYGQSWGGYGDLYQYHHKPLFKYEYINYWNKHYAMLKELLGDKFVLDYPYAGNPVGIKYCNSVIPIEAIRYTYISKQILTLLNGKDKPVICEIGGGQGGQVYTTLKNTTKPITYINMDIPEVLAMASYILCASFPEKKILLYGEGEVSKDYDIILLPNYCLWELKGKSVDLFFNQRSFPEMPAGTVAEYMSQIGRVCSSYLYHVNYNNHNKNQYGESYVQATGIIPPADVFKMVMQYPWYFTRLGEEVQNTSIALLYQVKINSGL